MVRLNLFYDISDFRLMFIQASDGIYWRQNKQTWLRPREEFPINLTILKLKIIVGKCKTNLREFGYE